MQLNIRTTLALCASLTLFACGDDDGGVDGAVDASLSPDADGADAPVPMDAGADAGDAGPADAGADGGADSGADAGDDAGVACGDGQIDVSTVTGTEGIAIAPDGAIYFSQSGGVGRALPDGSIDRDWVVGLPSTVWGLAYRDSDDTLFVASPGDGGAIYQIDTTEATPTATEFVTEGGRYNGLIVVPEDGSIIFSDFGGGRVLHADASGDVTQINDSPIAQPNGVFLDDDGTLLVLAYGSGEIFRLTLDGYSETVRVPVADLGINPDGIAKDDEGRYYITDNGGGALLRFNGDFEDRESLQDGLPSAANVAFGRGPLSCTDLYVTSGGPMGRLDVGASGRP